MDITILICEILFSVGLFINLFWLHRKNKKLTEMVSLQKDRIREEKLDAMLQNQRYMEREEARIVTNDPYDVAYHEETGAVWEGSREHISVQVEEMGILSTKKYVIHVFEHVEIGRADTNKIILNDVSVSDHQIQLLRAGEKLFAKNLDIQVPVVLKRAKKAWMLTEDGVCIQSGDQLELGNTTLRLRLI